MDTATPTTGQTRPKLSIKNVGKEFDVKKGATFKALSDITFDVAPGEFVSVVGPSGCGKSTLLRMIAGLDVPSTGSIEIAQDNPNRSTTAVVFQEYSIFPWKTVEENVAFGLRMRGVDRKEALQTARMWLAKVNLAGFEKRYPSTLSGGMRQRVAVARALALDPEVLLLDEPFAALDAQMREVLQEELLHQWQDTATSRSAMLVTHSLDEAIMLGDTIVLMSATPGVVRAKYDVPFERPRVPSLRATKEFAELRDLIWNDLREEVQAANALKAAKAS